VVMRSSPHGSPERRRRRGRRIWSREPVVDRDRALFRYVPAEVKRRMPRQLVEGVALLLAHDQSPIGDTSYPRRPTDPIRLAFIGLAGQLPGRRVTPGDNRGISIELRCRRVRNAFACLPKTCALLRSPAAMPSRTR
jgi:hypothetical protein